MDLVAKIAIHVNHMKFFTIQILWNQLTENVDVQEMEMGTAGSRNKASGNFTDSKTNTLWSDLKYLALFTPYDTKCTQVFFFDNNYVWHAFICTCS